MKTNVVRHVRDDGAWTEIEHDIYGNLLKFTESSGFWTKTEFNDNNKPIAFENSSGTKITITYDE